MCQGFSLCFFTREAKLGLGSSLGLGLELELGLGLGLGLALRGERIMSVLIMGKKKAVALCHNCVTASVQHTRHIKGIVSDSNNIFL